MFDLGLVSVDMSLSLVQSEYHALISFCSTWESNQPLWQYKIFKYQGKLSSSRAQFFFSWQNSPKINISFLMFPQFDGNALAEVDEEKNRFHIYPYFFFHKSKSKVPNALKIYHHFEFHPIGLCLHTLVLFPINGPFAECICTYFSSARLIREPSKCRASFPLVWYECIHLGTHYKITNKVNFEHLERSNKAQLTFLEK